MINSGSDVSRRSLFRGVLGLSVLGAGGMLAGCGATEEFRGVTGAYGVSEPRTVAYGPNEDEQYGMFAVPLQENGEPVTDRVPVVVMIHGGSWDDASDMSYMTDIGVDLVSYGVLVWSIAYRGAIHSGGSQGGPSRPGWPVAGHDVAAGVDFLPRLADHVPVEFDTDRVVVLGHSAGGHLAVWAASRHRLEEGEVGADPAVRPVGCVAMAGVYNLVSAFHEDANDRVESLMGGTPDEKRDAYREASPQGLLPIGVPVIACHGRQDELVPVHQAEDYVAAAQEQGDPAELGLVDRADHNAWTVPDNQAWGLARDHTLRLVGL